MVLKCIYLEAVLKKRLDWSTSVLGHYVCESATPNVYTGESLLSISTSQLECGTTAGKSIIGDFPIAAIAAPASLVFLIIVIVIIVVCCKRKNNKQEGAEKKKKKDPKDAFVFPVSYYHSVPHYHPRPYTGYKVMAL